MASVNHLSSHPDPNIAYHFDWEFRHEAALWIDGQAVGVNFHPVATELRKWLLRQGQVSVFLRDNKLRVPFTNPYTYHASAIAAIFINSMNAGYEFANSTAPTDDLGAAIEAVRSYSEQVLYIARFCEVAIKQLLYCTQIPQSYYTRAALGGLLESDCSSCRREGKSRHKNSMLGSLAHRYHLCMAFDQCLIEHLKIVKRRRDATSAHAEVQALSMRPAADSRATLAKDSFAAGEEFVHMLQHISELETEMMDELRQRIANDSGRKIVLTLGSRREPTNLSSGSADGST